MKIALTEKAVWERHNNALLKPIFGTKGMKFLAVDADQMPSDWPWDE